MVSKKSSADAGIEKKGRVRVGELKLNKETVKDLTRDDARKVKGGATGNCLGEGILGGKPTQAGANCG